MSLSPETKPTLSPFEKSSSSSSEEILPSTSQDYKNPNSSPALAQSVPSSHEATSPPEAANGSTSSAPPPQYVYFTTAMANQADLDIEKERDKYDTLIKWMNKKKEQMMLARQQQSPFSPNLAALGDAGPGSSGPVIGKDEVVEIHEISPTYFNMKPNIGELEASCSTSSLKRKSPGGRSDEDVENEEKPPKMIKIEPQEVSENPLKRLQMMTDDQQYSNSNMISEVVENGSKKDERAAKMEKLEDIQKCVQEAMGSRTPGAHTPSYPSPGQYPPGMPHPGAFPGGMPPYPGVGGGPFSVGAYPPPQVGPPYSGGPYPGMHPFGYPMSAPPGKFVGSPGVYPNGMPMHPGAQTPRMHPAYMHQQMMAAAAAAQQSAKSPRHSPAAVAFHQHQHQMFMQQMHRQSPYGFPGQPPHPAMMNPQNSLMMVARNGPSPMDMPMAGPSSGWAPQLTPCYPPSFPPAAPTPRVPSTPATPIK